MTVYAWAWLIVVVAAPLALFAVHRGLRRAPARGVWLGLLVLIGVLLVLPAPVPGYSGRYAPAFLVFLFEWWFQSPGEPRNAGLILAAGAIATLAVILLVVSRRRRRDAGSSADAPGS